MKSMSVSLLALLVASPVLADSYPALPATDVEDANLVVSASRVTMEAREIGSAITVVDQAAIRRNQYIFAKDALQEIPGVVLSSDRAGTLSSVSIRGSSNDEVLWLVDGIELGDPSNITTQFQPDNLTARDIARIEVLRGNQSSLYGSDAIGGVVNIVTQRATEEGIALNAEAEYGSHETVNGGASILGRSGPLDFRLSATGYRHGGPSVADPATADPAGSVSEDDEYWRYGFSGRVGLEATETLQFQALGFWLDSASDLDNTTSDSGDSVDRREYAAAVQGSYRSADGQLKADLTGSRYVARRRYFGEFYRADGDVYKGTKDQLSLTLGWGGEGPVSIAAGGNLEWEKTDQLTGFSGEFDADIDTASAYAEIALRPVDGLTLTGAARLDDNSRFGSFDTYRGTIAYVAGPVKLRASYGTGAKAPGLYQLFDPAYGNPNLDVETSRGGDAGIDLAFGGRVTGELTYFFGRKRNEILFDGSIPPFGRYGQYGRTRSRGVEVGLSAEPFPWLRLRQTYSFIDHEVQDGEANPYVDSGRPDYAATSSVTVAPTERAEVTARVRFRGADRSGFGGTTGAYTVVDLLASYRLTDAVELYGRLVNLTDEQYQLSYGTQSLGFSGYGGVRLSF
jgi:vitamin B12 transporter